MKQFYLLAAALLITFGLSAQTIFVDADATGAGDGSSWENAYTNITDAVNAAAGGEQIWIADGTYNEGASVFVDKPLAFIGGFNGTETMVDESDPTTNVVTMTGDALGDDIVGSFDTLRTDNFRIFDVDSLIPPLFGMGTPSVVFQAMSFQNGQAEIYTDPDFEAPIDPSAGGAIRSYSPTGVRVCTFTDNDGDYGAGPALLFGADNSVVEGSSFSGNRSFFASILYARSVVGPFVAGCAFNNNVGNRGGFLGIGTLGSFVTDCSFDSNVDPTGRGALSFIQADVATVFRSSFTNNQADLAAAIYLADVVGNANDDPENILIDSCSFNGNTGARFGGGLTSLDADFAIRRSQVLNTANLAANGLGGFIYQQGVGRTVVVDSCLFEGNVGQIGGAILARDSGTVLTITNSTFNGNGAGNANRGGAIGMLGEFTGAADPDIAQGTPVLNVDNCIFFNNQAPAAPGPGGAFFLQGGGVQALPATVTNSEFVNNSASGSGGGIFTLFGVDLVVENTYFGSNNANIGGAIYGQTGFRDDPRADTDEEAFQFASITVESSQFQINGATQQGAAIYGSGVSVDATNNEFYQNLVSGDADGVGIGGAMGLNGDSARILNFNVINNTFVGNAAVTEGDHIAVFQDLLNPTDITETNLFLTNNAFFSFGVAGAVVVEENANGAIFTNGGNFFNEAPDDFTLDATDVLEEFALEDEYFVSPLELERELINLSPLPNTDLVDGGVTTAETPTEDRAGNTRDANPDIGANELLGETVVDIAVNSGIHNTLVSVLGTANLVT
ncbi:MAG: hypothetical protein AAFO91_02395, partial [Bacteroidota bacterium]